MGELKRFINPKEEKMFEDTANAVQNTIWQGVADGNRVHIDTAMVALARGVYAVFYAMIPFGNPQLICEQIAFFEELMAANLPTVKKNIWHFCSENNDGTK